MKKSNRKTRVIFLLVSVLMVFSFLAGCKPKSDPNGFSSITVDRDKYPGFTSQEGYKFENYPITLTVWYNSPKVMGGGWGDDEVSKWIKEKLGVTLDIMYATTGTSEELSTKLITKEKLPDLIVMDPYSSVSRQMTEQGYLQALDVVAEKYYPDFLKILPGGMQDIFTNADGHFYNTAGWYADPVAVREIRDKYGLNPGAGDQTLSLNREYYEAQGKPDVSTPDKLFTYLDTLHKKHPEIEAPVIPYIISWGQTKDTVNFFYRMYGGGDWLYEENGGIKLCVGDPKYKEALKMMNKMYRAAIFTKETLGPAYDIKVTNLRAKSTFAYIGQDWQWFSLIREKNNDQLDSVAMPVETPSAVPRDQLKLKDLQLSTTGSEPAVYISKDATHPQLLQRIIEYLAFRYTEECQIAERFGIEGSAWERDPENQMISWTKEVKDYEAENGWQAGSEKYGYNNAVHSWFTSLETTLYESTNTRYPIQQYNGELNGKYLKDERIYDLTKKIKDENTQIMYDQFIKAANESITKCLQADSEAIFEAEYQNYINLANSSKQPELEAYFTEQYKYWKSKGI